MAEINNSTERSKKKSFSKTGNHRSTKVDLTPMVDLGFLLITFFVFTTALSTYKVMDRDEPKGEDPKPIRASGALTIMIGKDHSLYYYEGELKEQTAAGQIKRTGFKEIRALILNKKRATKSKDLMYIFKANEHATFGDEMKLMDEMLICEIPAGHYVEADLTKKEATVINSKSH